ncbi:MAG TPA: DUF5677 domain-containing protein [Candidatus Sulfotelmatobacter sp.]|jgi:hypothetical protein
MNTPPMTAIQVGYPDFWPVVLEKHKSFFFVTRNLGPTIDDLFSVAHSEPIHKVCRHLAKMVANSVGAVLLLAMNGYGIDAIKVARTMFEAAVTVAYLKKHPDEFDDYFDFHFIVGMKRHRYIEKHAPAHMKNVTPEVIESIKRGYARVSPRFMANGKVRGRWSKRHLSQLCSDLGLEEYYLSFYELASNITHANISGVMSQADPQPGVLDVDLAPSEQFVDMALSTAHCMFVLAIAQYVALARPEKQSVVDQIESDFVQAWKG